MQTNKWKNKFLRNSINLDTYKKARSLYRENKQASKRKNSLHNKRNTKLSSKENFLSSKITHTHINNVYVDSIKKKKSF